MAQRQFQVVEDETAPDYSAAHTTSSPTEPSGAAVAVLMLSLKALSQRALIAVDNLFTLLTVFSAYWLWHSIPSPDSYQLVALGMYALFVLAANVIVRRK